MLWLWVEHKSSGIIVKARIAYHFYLQQRMRHCVLFVYIGVCHIVSGAGSPYHVSVAVMNVNRVGAWELAWFGLDVSITCKIQFSLTYLRRLAGCNDSAGEVVWRPFSQIVRFDKVSQNVQ
jgi:hypothetical protein